MKLMDYIRHLHPNKSIKLVTDDDANKIEISRDELGKLSATCYFTCTEGFFANVLVHNFQIDPCVTSTEFLSQCNGLDDRDDWIIFHSREEYKQALKRAVNVIVHDFFENQKKDFDLAFRQAHKERTRKYFLDEIKINYGDTNDNYCSRRQGI